MSNIKILRQNGIFNGKKKKKQDCISIKISELNRNDILKITKFPNAKVIRLLIDTKSNNDMELLSFLNKIYYDNPSIELHINIEFDKYFEYSKTIIDQVNFNNKSITLWPDGELEDRSYLDLNNLNCKTIIPLQYIMWHSNIENANKANLFFLRSDTDSQDGTFSFSITNQAKNNNDEITFEGGNLYNLEEALFLKKTAYKVLSDELKSLTDCNLADDQKILVLMKYFVDNFKYTWHPKIPNTNITIKSDRFAQKAANTLYNKEGVCAGIAEAFMILLNNPIMKIDCRCIGGLAEPNNNKTGHEWNMIKITDEKIKVSKWFYFDATWNIHDKNYYNWSFLEATELSARQIFDCANPVYESHLNVLLDEDTMKYRLEDALNRIENNKRGIKQIRIIYSLDDIVKNAHNHKYNR